MIVSVSEFGSSMSSRLHDALIYVISPAYQLSTIAYRDSVPTHDADIQLISCSSKSFDLEVENQQLRKLLEFRDRFVFKGIGAEVIGRSYDPTRSKIMVNRGSVDGVRDGSAVVAYDGILVGIVTDVSLNTSYVRLLTDPQSKIAGRLLTSSQSEGIVSGGHGIVVRMDLIPRDEKIEIGTQLVTSGLDDQLPRGLVVGKVINVEPDANSLFLRAIIAPTIAYETLNMVMIAN